MKFTLTAIDVGVYPIENGQCKWGGFACARMRLQNHIVTLRQWHDRYRQSERSEGRTQQLRWKTFLLNFGRLFKSVSIDTAQQLLRHAHCIEVGNGAKFAFAFVSPRNVRRNQPANVQWEQRERIGDGFSDKPNAEQGRNFSIKLLHSEESTNPNFSWKGENVVCWSSSPGFVFVSSITAKFTEICNLTIFSKYDVLICYKKGLYCKFKKQNRRKCTNKWTKVENCVGRTCCGGFSRVVLPLCSCSWSWRWAFRGIVCSAGKTRYRFDEGVSKRFWFCKHNLSNHNS